MTTEERPGAVPACRAPAAAPGARRRYLALLRHAEPERVGSGSLTARGRRQAEAAGRHLARLAPRRVLSSGVPRAAETAVGLGFAVASEVDERFHGLRIDHPPVMTHAERAALYADPAAAPYGGESLVDLLQRGRPALAEVAATGGGVVVAHDMINSVLIADVLGIDLGLASKLAQDHGASNLFELRATGPDLVWMNVTADDPLRVRAGDHLAGSADAVVERRLYLVRHGEAWNFPSSGERMASVSGHALTETGLAQARALGDAFAGLDAPAIFASDLQRAMQTAAGFAGGRTVTPDAGLRELEIGELDGLSVQELFERCPGFLSDPDAPIPGGETATACADRVERAARSILADTAARDVVIVAHGGVNRLITARLLGLPLAAGLRIRTDWASVSVLEYAAGEWWARCLNWTPEGLGAFDRIAPIAGLTPEQARAVGR